MGNPYAPPTASAKEWIPFRPIRSATVAFLSSFVGLSVFVLWLGAEPGTIGWFALFGRPLLIIVANSLLAGLVASRFPYFNWYLSAVLGLVVGAIALVAGTWAYGALK